MRHTGNALRSVTNISILRQCWNFSRFRHTGRLIWGKALPWILQKIETCRATHSERRKRIHVTCPCKAIMAASEASFWSLPQGGPIDFPSDAIGFRKLFTEVASARSACSFNCFSGIPRNLKPHASAARASASRKSTPSALCVRKCTARSSSTVQQEWDRP
jgi:hypothetical protein